MAASQVPSNSIVVNPKDKVFNVLTTNTNGMSATVTHVVQGANGHSETTTSFPSSSQSVQSYPAEQVPVSSLKAGDQVSVGGHLFSVSAGANPHTTGRLNHGDHTHVVGQGNVWRIK